MDATASWLVTAPVKKALHLDTPGRSEFRYDTSGPASITLWPFLATTFAGSIIWNGVLAGAGYVLGSRYADLDRYVGPAGIALTVLAIGYYFYRVVTWQPRGD